MTVALTGLTASRRTRAEIPKGAPTMADDIKNRDNKDAEESGKPVQLDKDKQDKMGQGDKDREHQDRPDMEHTQKPGQQHENR
jgi:hypothetical protein